MYYSRYNAKKVQRQYVRHIVMGYTAVRSSTSRDVMVLQHGQFN